jgi:DNA-binding MarR family transcriptional regulator
MIDRIAILSLVEANLAITLSDLAEKMFWPQAQMRETMKEFVERQWVKAREMNKGNEVLYSITGEGVKELEKTTRKGISALF